MGLITPARCPSLAQLTTDMPYKAWQTLISGPLPDWFKYQRDLPLVTRRPQSRYIPTYRGIHPTEINSKIVPSRISIHSIGTQNFRGGKLFSWSELKVPTRKSIPIEFPNNSDQVRANSDRIPIPARPGLLRTRNNHTISESPRTGDRATPMQSCQPSLSTSSSHKSWVPSTQGWLTIPLFSASAIPLTYYVSRALHSCCVEAPITYATSLSIALVYLSSKRRP